MTKANAESCKNTVYYFLLTMAKLLLKLVTLGLLLTFTILFVISLHDFLSNKTGTTIKIEHGGEFPDLTICPGIYQDNVEIITGETNHSISDIDKLPSMKNAIRLITIGQTGYVTESQMNKTYPPI